MDAIDLWDEIHKRDVRASRERVQADPAYPDLVREAEQNDLIPAPLYILEATSSEYLDQLYLWRGCVWVKRNTG